MSTSHVITRSSTTCCPNTALYATRIPQVPATLALATPRLPTALSRKELVARWRSRLCRGYGWYVSHAQAAVRAGATAQEAEATILMHGDRHHPRCSCHAAF